MQRTRYHIILWLCLFIISIFSLISISFIPDVSSPVKNAFLVAFIILMLTSILCCSLQYLQYLKIKMLATGKMNIIAKWSYLPTNSLSTIKYLKEELESTKFTCLLSFLFAIILSLFLAYSGGSYVFIMGYMFILISVVALILSMYFISDYYNQFLSSPDTVIFGENEIYFMGQLFSFQKKLLFLESVSICPEPFLTLNLAYGHYDLDSPPVYIVSIPIPKDQVEIATELCAHYSLMISENMN